MQKVTQLNIFLKIADPLYSQIIDVSQEIKKDYKTTFYLDGIRFIPHLSLYLFALPEKNKAKAIEILGQISKQIHPITIESKSLVKGDGNLIMLLFDKKTILYQYHLKVLNNLNPAREGSLRHKYTNIKYFDSLPLKDKKYLNRYGSQYILDQFNPHITIAKVKNENDCDNIINRFNETLSQKSTKTVSIEAIEDNYKTSITKKTVFSQNL